MLPPPAAVSAIPYFFTSTVANRFGIVSTSMPLPEPGSRSIAAATAFVATASACSFVISLLLPHSYLLHKHARLLSQHRRLIVRQNRADSSLGLSTQGLRSILLILWS